MPHTLDPDIQFMRDAGIVTYFNEANGGNESDEEANDNAHLFSGAARLLEAVKGLVDEAQPLGIDRPTYQAAIDAIETVEGGRVVAPPSEHRGSRPVEV